MRRGIGLKPAVASSAHPQDLRPGRSCPLHYRYGAESFRREADLRAETLYVVGGLYGNPFALQRILELAAAEEGDARLVFNGDFNWFNIDGDGFRRINDEVLRHTALRGNVETELFSADEDAGCGCGYPGWVGEAEVDRSNRIMSMLRVTARDAPDLTRLLAALPMTLLAQVGEARIAIVHGDADSLAGWGFSQEALRDKPVPAAAFARAEVDVFASSHTCLPVAGRFVSSRGPGLLFNNGAAGMPNFSGTHYGLITRISLRPATGAMYGAQVNGVHVEALPVHYDHAAWLRHFDLHWPAGSPASLSYRARIADGPDYLPGEAQQLSQTAATAQALPAAVAQAQSVAPAGEIAA